MTVYLGVWALSLRGLKPATDLRVKTGQGFDELKLLFPGFSGVFFDQTRCAGLAGFEQVSSGCSSDATGVLSA